MVVQIRLWLLVKQRKKVQKFPACQGGVPEGRGGFYKFASSEFLHKPPRLLAFARSQRSVAPPTLAGGELFTISQLHNNSYLNIHCIEIRPYLQFSPDNFKVWSILFIESMASIFLKQQACLPN